MLFATVGVKNVVGRAFFFSRKRLVKSTAMKCHQLVDPRAVHMRRITSIIFCLLLSQFEPVAGDLSSERARSRELAAKIAKRDPLDVQKVLYEARLCLVFWSEIIALCLREA